MDSPASLRWQLQAPQTADLVGPGGARARWMKHLFAGHQASRPIEPAPDLDGDGTRDLVWAFGRTAAILAISGKDGSMLWNFVAEPDGSGGSRPDIPVAKNSPGLVTARDVAGDPVVADLDADGVPDLAATFIFSEIREVVDRAATAKSSAPVATWKHRRVVVAVSGRSGRLLWASQAQTAVAEHPQPAVVVARCALETCRLRGRHEVARARPGQRASHRRADRAGLYPRSSGSIRGSRRRS